MRYCVSGLKWLYHKFLREACDLTMRRNTPVSFIHDLIRKYGHTDEAVGLIRPKINKCNRKAKSKKGDEYEKLVKLPKNPLVLNEETPIYENLSNENFKLRLWVDRAAYVDEQLWNFS